jgi:alpha-beta hydrolase superfamily lysophospholipase
MLVDLVRTNTRDDIRLEGAFHAPQGAARCPVDAFVIVHGTGGNFYGSTMLENLAGMLQQRGHAVLRANTRGHDNISTAVTTQGGRRQGAAYELVDDCRLDLAAWVDWLRERAGPRIGLVGHSLGAVKCLYAAANEATLSPSCIIALSPPRLSYAWFCESTKRDEFLEAYRRAEEKTAANEGSALIDVRFPLPVIITAAGYAEKYGPDERYNFLRFLRRVKVPTLFTYGSIELANNVAFAQAPEAIAELQQTNVQVRIVPGADHFYTGVHEPLFQQLAGWFDDTGGCLPGAEGRQ